MKSIYRKSLVLFWSLSFVFGASTILEAQIKEIDKTYPNEEACPTCFYELSSFPERIVTPYADVLLGISTFRDFGYRSTGIAAEMRGGLLLGRSMLIGTGVSFVTFDGYETGAVLPLELGYRTKNERFDFVSSLGYTYLLFGGNTNGRTIAADVYMRPLVSIKRMRFVIAAGGMMYDFGNDVLVRCSNCGNGTGPRYTFRLRAGVGF